MESVDHCIKLLTWLSKVKGFGGDFNENLSKNIFFVLSVPPKIITNLNDEMSMVRAAKGDREIELKCKAQGDTPITVKWTKVSVCVGKKPIPFLGAK